MRLLVKQGADPLFVHHSEYVFGGRFEKRTDALTTLMAATGMGGGAPWAQPPRAEREALTLEAVAMLAELGVDINATSTSGSTALDGAKALGYQSVVQFLTEKGAKSGKPVRKEAPAEVI